MGRWTGPTNVGLLQEETADRFLFTTGSFSCNNESGLGDGDHEFSSLLSRLRLPPLERRGEYFSGGKCCRAGASTDAGAPRCRCCDLTFTGRALIEGVMDGLGHV